MLTAAIAKNPKIDVIVSDFGPSLVGALPVFEKSGRSIPALATSDGNVLSCFYEDHKAKNPDFKLFTVATGNDNARLAVDWAVALATGGKPPDVEAVRGTGLRGLGQRQAEPGDVRARTFPATSTSPRRCPARTRRSSSSRPHRAVAPVGIGPADPTGALTDAGPDEHGADCGVKDEQ